MLMFIYTANQIFGNAGIDSNIGGIGKDVNIVGQEDHLLLRGTDCHALRARNDRGDGLYPKGTSSGLRPQGAAPAAQARNDRGVTCCRTC